MQLCTKLHRLIELVVERRDVVEPHPGPVSVLLQSSCGRTFSLPPSQTQCHLHNQLLSHLSNEPSPAYLTSQHQRNVFWKREGWNQEGRANRKTMSTNPKRDSDSVANEGVGDEGLCCMQIGERRVPRFGQTTPNHSRPHQRFHLLLNLAPA